MIRATIDLIGTALRSLWANPLRTALTLLGIVIGTAAVIAMASATEGLRRRVEENLAILGAGVFQVQRAPFGFASDRERAAFAKRKPFVVDDVRALLAGCRRCLRVAGEAWSNLPPNTVRVGGKAKATPTQFAGGTVGFFENNGYHLDHGRSFDEREVAAGAPVAIIGADVADSLFEGQSPLGKTILLSGSGYTVIGTMERRGSSMDGDSNDNLVAIPLSRFQQQGTLDNDSINITIAAADPTRREAAEDEVVQILRRRRGTPADADNDFDLFSNQSQQSQFDKIAGAIAAGAIGISAIALLIGGVGVMNIMLVAVTERTREIGVRRALGARRRSIMGQFVLEAIFLTSLGGAFGVVTGWAVSRLVAVQVGIPVITPVWAVVLAMLASGGVGLVFGSYPAWHASQLDPVEAMRQE